MRTQKMEKNVARCEFHDMNSVSQKIKAKKPDDDGEDMAAASAGGDLPEFPSHLDMKLHLACKTLKAVGITEAIIS